MPILFTFILLLFTSIQSQAQAPQLLSLSKSPSGFGLPIECTLGEDCWVMNYVDYTPDDGEHTDLACLNRTYDAHKGTDFAILDNKAMEKGVQVLAAKDGTVTKIRDGEADFWASAAELEEIKTNRKECGNAVLIDHGNDIQTIYCHIKKNSITVKPNQKVKTGDKIGEVGLSGLTQFPHLHFGVIKNKKIIDPFTGLDSAQECGKKRKPLWQSNLDLTYQPFEIQSMGFASDAPKLTNIEKDSASQTTITAQDGKIILWSVLLGMREGDIIDLEIKDPNGKIFLTEKIIQDKNRARQFYYIGKNIDDKKTKEGAYSGKITVTRKNDKNKKPVIKQKINAALVTR